jgi:hypothetical protein
MSEKCRYSIAGCRGPVTHFCSECALNLSGYYCAQHAERHDNEVRTFGGSVFAQRVTGTDNSESPDSKEGTS